MLTYTNSFNCTVADNKSEVIITLFQNSPVIDDQGNFSGLTRETVSTISMTGELAKQLSETLKNLLGE